MDKQGYHCSHNLRLRSSMVLSEMVYWHDWATDEADTELINKLEGLLKELHQRKVAVCLVHERRPGENGWDKEHSVTPPLAPPQSVREGDGPLHVPPVRGEQVGYESAAAE